MCLLGISAPCHKIPRLINKIKLIQDQTLPDTIDNSSFIVQKYQSSNHTPPEDRSTPEEDEINQGLSSGMFPSNGPITLKENDHRCGQIFWDKWLECYKKKDPNCFNEPGLALLYKDCE